MAHVIGGPVFHQVRHKPGCKDQPQKLVIGLKIRMFDTYVLGKYHICLIACDDNRIIPRRNIPDKKKKEKKRKKKKRNGLKFEFSGKLHTYDIEKVNG